MRVDLSNFNNSWYNPGRGFLTRTLWHFANALFLQSPLNPSSRLKVAILRMSSINVKYPWNLNFIYGGANLC